MLVIRDAQLRILAQSRLELFEDLLATHLQSRFPVVDIFKDPAQVHAFVVGGMQLAKTFGIVNQFDVRRFLEFRAEYGVDFHNLPWASRILHDPTLSGCGKMEQIDHYSLFTLRPVNE